MYVNKNNKKKSEAEGQEDGDRLHGPCYNYSSWGAEGKGFIVQGKPVL